MLCFVTQQNGQWYFVAWHTEERYTWFGPIPIGTHRETVYDIPPGTVPAQHPVRFGNVADGLAGRTQAQIQELYRGNIERYRQNCGRR